VLRSCAQNAAASSSQRRSRATLVLTIIMGKCRRWQGQQCVAGPVLLASQGSGFEKDGVEGGPLVHSVATERPPLRRESLSRREACGRVLSLMLNFDCLL